MERPSKIILKELSAILDSWVVWFFLATQDIKLRYRRSAIGPMWLTLSMAITVYSMAFLYAHLFKIDLSSYFPYLCTGLISWTLISTIIIESTSTFIEAEGIIKNQATPFSLFTIRCLYRNVIIFFHNLLVLIPVGIFYDMNVNFATLQIVLGLPTILLNGFFWGSLLSVAGTRYRDVTQITTSVMQIVFFLSPMMWMPSSLPEQYRWAVEINPFFHFLNLIRQPMLGQWLSANDIVAAVLCTVVGFFLYCLVINKYRNKIVFWL